MRRDGIRLSRGLKLLFYGVFFALFATGAAWWIYQSRASQLGELGAGSDAVAPWLMRLHGGTAMAALVLLGILYPVHIVRGWQARRNRTSGVTLIAVVFLLIMTGYLLYYAGGEATRRAVSGIHLWVGLALPAIIIGHIWRGRVLRRRALNR